MILRLSLVFFWTFTSLRIAQGDKGESTVTVIPEVLPQAAVTEAFIREMLRKAVGQALTGFSQAMSRRSDATFRFEISMQFFSMLA